MKAMSLRGASPEEVQTQLSEIIAHGYQPTLAIIFISIKQDRSLLCKIFDDAGIAVFGATSNGEFTGEGVTSGEIAILLLDLDRSYFTVFFEEYPAGNYREITQALAKKALKKFAHPCFLIAGSNLNTDPEALLHGFEDILGKQANVFGGMAGDDFAIKEQFVFTNHQESSNGIVVIVFNEDRITINGRAAYGWKPLGTVKTVTKSVGNHVYTIDDVPVLDLIIKYGGLENVTPENFTLEHSTALSLQMQRETGDPVIRAGLVVDWDDHSYYCSGVVPQGSKVRLSLPPDFDVVEKVIKSCEELRANEIPEADALLMFNCAGRLLSLGPMISEEIEGVRKVWDVPIAGMFSNSELARATNGNLEMHNLTACTVVLKERTNQLTIDNES